MAVPRESRRWRRIPFPRDERRRAGRSAGLAAETSAFLIKIRKNSKTLVESQIRMKALFSHRIEAACGTQKSLNSSSGSGSGRRRRQRMPQTRESSDHLILQPTATARRRGLHFLAVAATGKMENTRLLVPLLPRLVDAETRHRTSPDSTTDHLLLCAIATPTHHLSKSSFPLVC